MMRRHGCSSGNSDDNDRPGAVSFADVNERDMAEHLRKLGAEWKTSDYFPQRQVVITIVPSVPSIHHVRSAVKRAAAALADSGMS